MPEHKPVDWNKPLQTRDGEPVTILGRRNHPTYPVVGIYGDPAKQQGYIAWMENGRAYNADISTHDLINVPEITHEYVNYYGYCRTGHSYPSFQEAQLRAEKAVPPEATLKITKQDGKIVAVELAKG
jgi:hypothetical protein